MGTYFTSTIGSNFKPLGVSVGVAMGAGVCASMGREGSEVWVAVEVTGTGVGVGGGVSVAVAQELSSNTRMIEMLS